MADEGGIWRTVSGRRIFIRDGQSLTDAMRESGKFEKGSKTKAEYGVKHRVWGKAAGTNYENLPDNKYRLTGDRDGEEIEVPRNESGAFELYKAPQTSGFVNGKFVGDNNVNAILSDGRIVLNDHDFNNDSVYKVKSIVEAESLRLAGMRKEGEFYRGTDNKKEIEFLKSGTMRVSTNHSTGETEDGVSVWDTPKYSFRYTYRVTGEISGVGSDGEPLLDPKTIKLVSTKSYGIKEYNAAMEKGKALFCETYGWTEEQYDEAKSGYAKHRRRL